MLKEIRKYILYVDIVNSVSNLLAEMTSKLTRHSLLWFVLKIISIVTKFVKKEFALKKISVRKKFICKINFIRKCFRI